MRSRRSLIVTVALLLLMAAVPVATDAVGAASGDSGPGVSTGQGGVFYPPHDVAFNGARGWFTTRGRFLPAAQAGSAEDRRCGPRNAQGQPIASDRWGCGRVGRISPSGVSYSTANLMDEPWAVVTYPHDGAAFVSDRQANRVWRIGPSGGPVTEAVRLFEAPAGTPPASVDQSKALRPTEMLRIGGRIWYLAIHWNGRRDSLSTARRQQIGRIGWFDASNPDIRRSWRVDSLRDLGGLALDAQGRLWFTGNGDGPGVTPERGIGFGRINPSGPNPLATLQVFRRAAFPLDNRPSNPTRIIRGPDNELWFVDNGAKRLCRFSAASPLSTLECFPRAGDGQPYDLERGQDGAVWYTDASLDRLGRITVDGDMTSVTPPHPFDSPWGLTRRGDRLYTAAAASGQIPWYEP